MSKGIRVIYDGKCPLCQSFVQRVRLERSCGPIELIDARTDLALVSELKARGMSLDDGIVACIEDECVHADEALTRLALLSTRRDSFNRLMHWTFSRPKVARLIYPLMRVGRSGLLWLLRRERISR
ncbi:DCC1-like thiol-disulfide oxidoreductase family protein [Lysobacter sp. CA196]|uniref:DCC1-like thiol-disulfide oxidoreductase family protein n=1 Tax=Lysobacter sp. CA196 TaxID=3455606 RepID=UPI003F8D5690